MLEVGQRLYYVPSNKRMGDPEEVEVTKIGHKWAVVNTTSKYAREFGRIGKDSLILDGGQHSSPGRCYLSQQDYEYQVACCVEWQDINRRMGYSPKQGVTLDAILEAKRLLGLL